MRRGKITNINFFVIILVALFTLFSFLADQLVIRNEDNLRKLNVEYDNKITELRTNQSVSNSILSLQMRASSIVDHQLYNRNFWIKNLILFELDKNFKKYFTKRKLNYQWDIKNNLVANLTDIVADTNSVRKEFQNIILWLDDANYKKITDKNSSLGNPFDLFHNTNAWEKSKDFLRDRDLYINLILENEDKVETLKNSFNMKNWFDVYRLTMLSVENLYQDMNHLDDYTEYFDNIILDNETSITNIVKKQKKVSLNKNILILISILTQITALLFLLILFRNMLRNK